MCGETGEGERRAVTDRLDERDVTEVGLASTLLLRYFFAPLPEKKKKETRHVGATAHAPASESLGLLPKKQTSALARAQADRTIVLPSAAPVLYGERPPSMQSYRTGTRTSRFDLFAGRLSSNRCR